MTNAKKLLARYQETLGKQVAHRISEVVPRTCTEKEIEEISKIVTRALSMEVKYVRELLLQTINEDIHEGVVNEERDNIEKEEEGILLRIRDKKIVGDTLS